MSSSLSQVRYVSLYGYARPTLGFVLWRCMSMVRGGMVAVWR